MYYVLKHDFFEGQVGSVERPDLDQPYRGDFGDGVALKNPPQSVDFLVLEENHGELGDFVFSAECDLVSKKFKETLEFAGVENIQYIPAMIHDQKTKQHYDFFILNIVGSADCIDFKKSKLTMRAIPGKIRTIHELHIDESKIPKDLKMFVDIRGHLILVNEELKRNLEAAKLQGVNLVPAEGYSN